MWEYDSLRWLLLLCVGAGGEEGSCSQSAVLELWSPALPGHWTLWLHSVQSWWSSSQHHPAQGTRGPPASQTSQHLQHNLQFRETGLGCHPAAFMLCNFYTGWLAGQWTIFPSLSSQSIATFTVNWYEVKCVNFSASLPAVITGVNMNMKLMLFVVISVFIMRLTETNVNWDVKYVHLKLQGVSQAQQD